MFLRAKQPMDSQTSTGQTHQVLCQHNIYQASDKKSERRLAGQNARVKRTSVQQKSAAELPSEMPEVHIPTSFFWSLPATVLRCITPRLVKESPHFMSSRAPRIIRPRRSSHPSNTTDLHALSVSCCHCSISNECISPWWLCSTGTSESTSLNSRSAFQIGCTVFRVEMSRCLSRADSSTARKLRESHPSMQGLLERSIFLPHQCQ